MNLRKNNQDWLIGYPESNKLSSFSRLPTKKHVLGRYSHLHFYSKGDTSARDIFKLVLGELKEVWEKAGVPVRSDNSCLSLLTKLFVEMVKIKKIDHASRDVKAGKEKIVTFCNELEKLCDISAVNAYEQLLVSRRPKWKEDWAFYEDQKSSRKYHMTGSIDLGVSKFLERREDRLSIDFRRSSTEDQKSSAFDVSEIVESANEEDQKDTEFTPLPLKKRKVPLTNSLEISSKKLSEVTASVADRCCLSVRQQLLFQSTIICKSGGKLNEISMSVSTVHRQRQNARKNIVLSIKADWEINKPKKAILHWDSKLFHLDIAHNEERVAVLISGSLNGPKLIGVPLIKDSTGKTQCDEVVKLAQGWNILEDIVGICFDTTASNTGNKKGAATLIEIELKRPLLWLACRHHHNELHIKHAFTALRGGSKSPDEPIFQHFRAEFSRIDIDYSNLNFFKWPTDIKSEIFNQASLVLKWAYQCLEEKIFPREDYLELIELTIIYLGGKLSMERIFKIHKPGAIHNARFMSHSIYILKMELLSNKFIMSNNEQIMIHRMAKFISLFYSMQFLRSRISVFAPVDDFKFFFAINWYQEEDSDIATAVISSINRHLWYLTEELVILSLFNEKLSEFTRTIMAKKLFSTSRPKTFLIGKPKFPTLSSSTVIYFLIGPRLWLLFDLLGLINNQEWL
ncbi:uncharacterized protein LOC136086720 [Hydra vulgaris]|uniref:Uncharacterized protein LOC136086720 n=1 Tax=Hydra vulgaris TaxID=6087 RepID=A0ABM4CT64_HYDVU